VVLGEQHPFQQALALEVQVVLEYRVGAVGVPSLLEQRVVRQEEQGVLVKLVAVEALPLQTLHPLVSSQAVLEVLEFLLVVQP
jgi:hypothetical protein